MDEQIGAKSLRFQGWRALQKYHFQKLGTFICYVNFGNFGVWPPKTFPKAIFGAYSLFLKLGCVFLGVFLCIGIHHH